MRSSGRYLVACVAVALVAGLMIAAIPGMADVESLAFVVSPNTLNLESNGDALTIHAEIAYSSVDAVRVDVNDVEPLDTVTCRDSRGDLVIRCSTVTLKDMVESPEATLRVTVVDKDGLTYTGTAGISVISEGK